MDLQASMAGCQLAHRRLRLTVGGIDDDTARRPSRLPGWTVAHVLTHLARNADSHVRVLEGALAGQHLAQYAGGAAERNAAIEAGAARPGPELEDDVVSSFVRLEEVWHRMTPEAWAGRGLGTGGGDRPCRHMPFFRWREVEMHHVDLGLGYQPSEWPEDYVAVELRAALAHLPGRIGDSRARALFLGWLTERADPPRLELEPWLSRPSQYELPDGLIAG
jgi:maleylpyruvate isomerase